MTAPRGARRPDTLPGSRARLGEGQGRPETLAGAPAPAGSGAGSAAEPDGDGARSKRPRGTARDRALNLLSFRDRSRRELERRLLQAGFEPDEVAEALDALARVGLVDDERFARAVVEHEATVRLSGRRAVRSALLAKGVDRATVDGALEDLGGDAERAGELAARRAPRLGGLPPDVAFRRLSSFLVRRGHAPGVARSAAARALGREGVDEPP